MGFWDTLKALFIYGSVKEAEEEATKSNGKPTLADLIAEEIADENAAAQRYYPKYEQLKVEITEAFNHLLDNTAEGITDLHSRRIHNLKLINAMPIMITLENDGELTSNDGVHMYKGIQQVFDNTYSSVTSFSADEIRSAFTSWNDLWHELTGKAGVTELGELWYDMIYLTPTGSESIQQMMTNLFSKICEAADTIARMSGRDYKYSSIPSTVAVLSYFFETLMEIHNSDQINEFPQYNEMLDAADYTMLQTEVAVKSHPKIMAYFARQ